MPVFRPQNRWMSRISLVRGADRNRDLSRFIKDMHEKKEACHDSTPQMKTMITPTTSIVPQSAPLSTKEHPGCRLSSHEADRSRLPLQ
jgi:hypothetical protein